MTHPSRRMNWLLSRAYRRVVARLDAGLADLGLTGTQSGALFSFDDDDGLLIGELGAKLALGQSATSGLVQRLVAAGFVERSEEEGDGRAARLQLTRLGRDRRKEAARRAQALNAALLKGFSEDEIAVIARWLAHVSALED
ncbi:MAG: MarR family transcriptional regulator [Alphaproteobacteria bacterium]|nr:MarR family transcriptional regulator [Alphaproteobacteria bacterium]